MNIMSAFVLFAVIWFMTLFVLLPLRLTTQGEHGEIVPGTHSGSPQVTNLRAKFLWTTGISVALFALIAAIIVWGGFTVRDLDVFGRMPPLPDGRGG